MATTDELAYWESEGSCAHCGLKDRRALTIHHLDQSRPRNDRYDNKLVLCHNCHQCHHEGKGPTKAQLKEIKKRLIVKTLTRPGVNALKVAIRKPGVVAIPFLVNHLVEHGWLKHHCDIQTCSDDSLGSNAEIVSLAIFKLTPEGKSLLNKWKLK